jgi:hypothetical protein
MQSEAPKKWEYTPGTRAYTDAERLVRLGLVLQDERQCCKTDAELEALDEILADPRRMLG